MRIGECLQSNQLEISKISYLQSLGDDTLLCMSGRVRYTQF
jgi:hypothetical protein